MDQTLPTPPADESWGVWHRAASEQVASALDAVDDDVDEACAALRQGRDFANRAMRNATPLEKLFTVALVDGINNVEAKVSGKERRFVLTESVMTHMLADLDQIITEMQMNPGQRPLQEWLIMLRSAVEGEDYGAPPFEGVEDGPVRG